MSSPRDLDVPSCYGCRGLHTKQNMISTCHPFHIKKERSYSLFDSRKTQKWIDLGQNESSNGQVNCLNIFLLFWAILKKIAVTLEIWIRSQLLRWRTEYENGFRIPVGVHDVLREKMPRINEHDVEPHLNSSNMHTDWNINCFTSETRSSRRSGSMTAPSKRSPIRWPGTDVTDLGEDLPA